MFTGIIEVTGIIERIEEKNENRTFFVKSAISPEFKIDESISHDGVCLTVETVQQGIHQVTAIDETLKKTILGKWKKGGLVNLERSLQFNHRLTGHLVQGHVDATARCIRRLHKSGSTEFTFQYEPSFAKLLIEKGSVSVNGISLTVFNVSESQFTVAIIPYTFEHTNLKNLEESMLVNIEFDIIGKYINRIYQLEDKK